MGNEVAVSATPQCVVCGGTGPVVHQEVEDRLFGAPGRWTYRRCASCRLVWQDPMAVEADVARLYDSYYTHATPAVPRPSWLRRSYRAAQRGYASARYDYPGSSGLQRIAGRLLALHPGRRADADFQATYLPHQPGGRLLDVGCGHGATLEAMAALGWRVAGIEPDERAVEVARSRGFSVAPGSVFTADLPPAAFDAVVMSHVIEHVHRPIETLRRCRELLSDGGTLVAVTPNADSWGHRVFGSAWRGLEPPRHLQVFSRAALEIAGRAAGFADVRVEVTIRNARGIYDMSRAIEDTGRDGGARAVDRGPTLRAELWQFQEWAQTFVDPLAGEELVLVAR
jgi:2-polyprenyl-3-methyl-5-hydroxy-6-metoxy-1,4-benzoquinol methylase